MTDDGFLALMQNICAVTQIRIVSGWARRCHGEGGGRGRRTELWRFGAEGCSQALKLLGSTCPGNPQNPGDSDSEDTGNASGKH